MKKRIRRRAYMNYVRLLTKGFRRRKDIFRWVKAFKKSEVFLCQ